MIRPHHVSIVTIMGCLAAACTEPVSLDTKERSTPEITATSYRHPLLHAPVLADGRVAIIDTVDAAADRRYAELHTLVVAEDGTETRSSGVVALRREQHAAKHAKQRVAPPLSPTIDPPLRDSVDALLAEGHEREAISVNIALRRPDRSLTSELRREIATGAIESVADLHGKAEQLKRARAAESRAAVNAVADALAELGATPGYRCQVGYCLDATVPAALVDRVASLPGVQRISVALEMQPESGSADAEDRSEVMQINQFLADGYDGEQDPSTRVDDIVFAVIESDYYDDEHPAWGKGGASWDRVASGHICTNGNGCTLTGNFPAPDPNVISERHPTQVSALIFANLMEGQDPNLNGNGNGSDDPSRYSGFARNALGRLFYAQPDAWYEAIDTIRSVLGPYEHVVNMSQGGGIACNGDEAAASSVNELYEDGSLLIKSAGNSSYSSLDPDDCRVTSPGAAMGAFTVAGLANVQLGVPQMRSAGIWYNHNDNGSSAGGSENSLLDGRGRTIIDLAAQASVRYAPTPNSAYTQGSMIGTSYAAPQVTGAAINFIDHFQDAHFNLEYEPGYLFVNLLLMGDRVACTDTANQCSTAELTTRFDQRFGAGRARFRRFDGEGMDSPYYYGTGMIPCLGDGESVHLEVPTDNSFVATASTVNDFKFVAWWYDRRHELTGTVANVDLRLYHVDANGNELGTLLTSDDDYDNKERLYYNEPGSKRLVVEIEGVDTVPADGTWNEASCGDGEVNVYFAYFAEDDARNDFDGPSWSSPNGVEPEDVVW